MGTPNSSEYDVPAADFYPYDLFMSSDPEEGRQAKKTAEIVYGIVAELRPILKHIAVPLPVLHNLNFEGCGYKDVNGGNVNDDVYYCRVRGVKLLEVRAHWPNRKEFLFLGEGGEFFIATLCPSMTEHYHVMVKDDGSIPIWSQAKLGWLIGALKRVLKEAAEKREQHLEALNRRGMVLDQLIAVLKRES